MSSDWDSAASASGEPDAAEPAVYVGNAASPGGRETHDPATDSLPARSPRAGGPHLAAWARLIRVLHRRWEHQAQRIRGLQRHGQTKRGVHDYRVAARRLLAVLRVCDAILPDHVPRKLRRSVAARLHEFRRLRDLQVMLTRIAPLVEQAPVWALFHKRLAAEQARARIALRTHLRKAEIEAERLRLHELQSLLLAQARGAPTDSLLAALHAMASDAQQRTARRVARMNPAKPGTLHRTRLAIKRARYILELIAEVESAPRAKAAHRAARAWQDQLGAIQDLHVLDLELAALRTKEPADVAAVMRFRAEIVTERNDAIVRFFAQRAELEDFVRRLAPQAPTQAEADPPAETA